jgi:type VI secretion system protein ImpK
MNKAPANNLKDYRLADLCSDSLMLTLQLRLSQNFGDADLLRERIIGMLNRMEKYARRENFDKKEIQRAKFALVAFIDETIISSEWEQKEIWLANPLQLQIFNRFDAGEKFFQLLDHFRTRPYDYSQLMEIYFLCLSLGFKGKYGIRDQAGLKLVIEDIYHDLKRVMVKKQVTLAPHGHRRDEISEVISREIPVWVVGIGAVVVGLIFYIIMTIMSQNTADMVVNFIHKLI